MFANLTDIRVVSLVTSLLVLIFSVIVHEIMHGYVALKFGDHTAENAGRLTLNPIPHIDPMGSILLPLIMIASGFPAIGAAKPVPVNPLHFSNVKLGEFMVSAAGISANFVMAIIAGLLHKLIPSNDLLNVILYQFTTINLYLGFLNLLPISPLDGSKMLISQLPYSMARQVQYLERYGLMILIALIYLPFLLNFPSPLFLLLNFLVNSVLRFLY